MRLLFLILLPFLVNAQTVHINGAGRTITVNAAGQPSSVNITTPPIPEYFDPQTGDITFTDDHFQFSIPGYAKTNFTARSTAGFVEFRTSETSISVKVGGDWSTASSFADVQSDCEVLVDGVYNQSVRLTADDVTQTYAITLPAGEKIVKLVNGYTANSLAGSVTLPDAGVYVQGVITTGPIEIKIPVIPENKWLFIGNSITTGASATHPAATGFPSLFRADGRLIQVDAWGGRGVATSTSGLGNTMAAFISDEMNGTVSNELFIFLGTNNYGLTNQTKANFKTYYQNMLDAIIAIRPDITIYCVSLLNRTNYDSGNSVGATGDDFADAIEELTTTRATTRFIYGKNLVSLGNTVDGIHPIQTGMQQMHDNLLIEYNLLNP